MSALGGRKKREIQAGPGWLATYGDMVTLLMAFFVMLYAISTVEEQKFEAFVSGLDIFDNPSAQQPALDVIGDSFDSPRAITRQQESGTDGQLSGGESLQDLSERLVQAAATSGFAGNVEVTADPRGIAVVITTDDVLFDSGRATLRPEGHAILGAVAPELASVHNEILVEGHADNVPLNRNGYTNWNLSTDRAVTVVTHFISSHGITPGRLTAVGYGEFHPRDTHDTPEGRARNRRVEIVILAEDVEATVPGPNEPAIPDPIGDPIDG